MTMKGKKPKEIEKEVLANIEGLCTTPRIYRSRGGVDYVASGSGIGLGSRVLITLVGLYALANPTSAQDAEKPEEDGKTHFRVTSYLEAFNFGGLGWREQLQGQSGDLTLSLSGLETENLQEPSTDTYTLDAADSKWGYFNITSRLQGDQQGMGIHTQTNLWLPNDVGLRLGFRAETLENTTEENDSLIRVYTALDLHSLNQAIQRLSLIAGASQNRQEGVEQAIAELGFTSNLTLGNISDINAGARLVTDGDIANTLAYVGKEKFFRLHGQTQFDKDYNVVLFLGNKIPGGNFLQGNFEPFSGDLYHSGNLLLRLLPEPFENKPFPQTLMGDLIGGFTLSRQGDLYIAQANVIGYPAILGEEAGLFTIPQGFARDRLREWNIGLSHREQWGNARNTTAVLRVGFENDYIWGGMLNPLGSKEKPSWFVGGDPLQLFRYLINPKPKNK